MQYISNSRSSTPSTPNNDFLYETDEQKKKNHSEKEIEKKLLTVIIILLRLKNFDLGKLCQEYNQQGILLSDLTYTKYKHISSSKQSLVPVLPKIELHVSEESPKKQQFYGQSIVPEQKRINFLNKQEIDFLQRNLLNQLDHQLVQYQHSLFKSRSQARSQQNINYSQHSNMELCLDHNRGALVQNQKQNEKSINQLRTITNENRRSLPKIKSYPTKKYSEEANHLVEREVIIQNDELIIPTHNVTWLDSDNDKWKPSMREGFSFTKIGKKCLLFGGISNKKHNDVAEFDLQSETWRKIETIGDKVAPRNNHTAIGYRKMIYIFGGEKIYDEHTRTRECLSEIRSLNTETMEWKFIKTNGDGIEGRRGHACTVIGKNMLIFGGINSKGYYLDSIYHLDLNVLKLSKAQLTESTYFTQGIAFHSLCSIYGYPAQLYRTEEHDQNWIKQEGVYCFGGEDNKGQLYNQLYILQTNQRPLMWTKLQTLGVPPNGRIRHTCCYAEQLGLMIVYGGISENSEFVNEVCLLRVDNLIWCKVEVGGYLSPGRAGHQAIIDEKRMIVFGGYNEKGFLNAEVECLVLDSRVAVKIQKQEEEMKKAEKTKEKGSLKPILMYESPRFREQLERIPQKNICSYLPIPNKISRFHESNLPNKNQLEKIQKMKEETQQFEKYDVAGLLKKNQLKERNNSMPDKKT